jgi:hypothetical protein
VACRTKSAPIKYIKIFALLSAVGTKLCRDEAAAPELPAVSGQSRNHRNEGDLACCAKNRADIAFLDASEPFRAPIRARPNPAIPMSTRLAVRRRLAPPHAHAWDMSGGWRR